MTECCEFRVLLENCVGLGLEPYVQRVLGGKVGVVVLDTDSPIYAALLERSESARAQGGVRPPFMWWQMRRTYTDSEWESAAWLTPILEYYWFDSALRVRTLYDLRSACPRCGLGRVQLTPLILPRALPK